MWDNAAPPSQHAPMEHSASYSISDVERETGITREILRIWERRYGFPTPHRDSRGDRQYCQKDVDALHQVRKLMDAGMRPGKILAGGVEGLRALHGNAPTSGIHPERDALLQLLKQHDAKRLDLWLRQQLGDDLDQFVRMRASQYCQWVGESWFHGELEIFEEHLFSERLESLLRQAMSALQEANQPPHVLLTTAAGELHGLGLLMTESLLRLAGCRLTSLGTNTPINDIIQAARRMPCDIVALSFSAAYPHAQVRTDLQRLRQGLPAHCQLWAGGQAVARLRLNQPGLHLIHSLDSLNHAVLQWRELAEKNNP